MREDKQYTRTAILLSGSAYNVRYSLQSQMENFVIPNNADVFILTEKRCKRRRTLHTAENIPDAWSPDWHEKASHIIQDDSELTDDDLSFMRETFGDRLKVLAIAEDIPSYPEYLLGQRQKMRSIANSYRHYNETNGLPKSFGFDIEDDDDGNLRCVVNQYGHVRKCYELMEQYEQEQGFKYNYIIRARMDFIVPEVIDVEEYTLNHDINYLYVMGSVNRDPFEFSDEFCWFSRRPIASIVFPALDRLGMLDDRKYSTYLVEQANDFRFGAETQWAILLKELGLPIINVKIYRSSRFTDGGDGFDYMNYMFRRDPSNIDDEYQAVCDSPTDINEHLPTLRAYAEQCTHITELGTRWGNSSIAFMASRPEHFISYDVQYNSRIERLKTIAKDTGINFDFRLENVEQIELEPTDLLFIDTNHHMEQCSVELRLHADKARKFIIFHDTTTFWEKGQGWEQGHGLRYAIEPFLEAHPEWVIAERFMNNNGLLILKRIA
jgi:hypothetical protein